MITVENVVDLIIDKKVKEIDDIIFEKKNEINKLETKYNKGVKKNAKKLKEFFNLHFDKEGLRGFILNTFEGWDFEDNGEAIDSYYEDLYRGGLVFKENVSECNDIKLLKTELDKLRNKKHDIEHSREKLIAEVTLEKLSSIDADFKENIEKLTDKIFNNTKLIN